MSASDYRPSFHRERPPEADSAVVVDAYDRQLRELAAVRLPSAGENERRLWVDEWAKDHPGVWVYLPWEGKLARILEREEYFEVVTNRNRDKITQGEQRALREKRVGDPVNLEFDLLGKHVEKLLLTRTS